MGQPLPCYSQEGESDSKECERSGVTVYSIPLFFIPPGKINYDAVEAHSCVDPLMPNSFLSKTQLLMINQLQDVSTRRSLSTAYRMTKTFGSKRPAVDLSLTVVFCSKKNLASVK